MCILYVDDIWGICLVADLNNELRKCKALCEDLLGVGAIAPHKTETGRRLLVIGYELDLASMLMTIMDKNVLKAAYSYLSVDLSFPGSRDDAPRVLRVSLRKHLRRNAPFDSGALRLFHGSLCGHFNPGAHYACRRGTLDTDLASSDPSVLNRRVAFLPHS